MRLIVSCLLCRQQEHAGLNSTESMTRALISDDNIARQSALGPVQLGYVPPYSPPSDSNTSSRISHQHHRTHFFSSQHKRLVRGASRMISAIADDDSHPLNAFHNCADAFELTAFGETV